jgi:hypothetical protein
VRVDVGRGLVTHDEARRLYGVVVTDDLAVDVAATAARRAEIRAGRLARGVRLGEDSRSPSAGNGRERLRIGDVLAVRETAAGAVLGCARCGRAFGLATEDPRGRALMVEAPLSSLSPLNVHGLEAKVVVRMYCCPGCATMFSSDVHLRGEDPARPEFRLSL